MPLEYSVTIKATGKKKEYKVKVRTLKITSIHEYFKDMYRWSRRRGSPITMSVITNSSRGHHSKLLVR